MNAESRNMEQDLGYVRGVVQRAQRGDSPAAIYYLWAVICLAGFTLADFVPRRVPLFWAIAGPVGFGLSAWLGARHGRLVGQVSREEGARWMLHWAGTGLAIVMTFLLADTQGLSYGGVGQVIVLIVALSYWVAGVHLAPVLKWIGLVGAVAYLIIGFFDFYPWTIAGIVFAAGLIAAGWATPGPGNGR